MPPLPAPFAKRGTVGHVASQAALFQEVTDFLAAVAAQRSLFLLLEDLHWSDLASLDLLRVVARTLGDHRLLVLVTFRGEEVARQHPLYALAPALVREAKADRLDLRPLDDTAVRALVDRRYGLAPSDADRLVFYLQGWAEGNVLFVSELLRDLEEERVLRREGEAWSIGPLTNSGVPPLLRHVIDARVARLSAVTQQLISVAAVIGQAVPYGLWARVVETEEGPLLDAVTEAEDAHIMAENRAGTGATFTHALVHKALYESVQPSQRRRWHRLTGEVLAASPDADPDAVAGHLSRAADSRAAIWLVRAGERAYHAYAWLTAAERFETALALLERGADHTTDRGWLLVRLGWLRRFADPQAGIAALERASTLAAEAQDRVLAVTASVRCGILRCRAGDFRRGLGELAGGVAAVDSLTAEERAQLSQGASADDAVSEETGRCSLALWLAFAGRYREADAIARQVIASDEAFPQGGAAAGTHPVARYARALVYAANGQPDEAQGAFAAARATYRAQGNHVGIGQTALHELEWVLLPYFTERVQERHALATESERAWVAGSGALVAGDALQLPHVPNLVVEGQWTEARRLACAVRAASMGPARRLVATRALAMLAHQQGQCDLAWRLVREWLPATDREALVPGDTRFLDLVALYRLAVGLALDTGDLAAARGWLGVHDHYLAWSGAVLGRSDGALLWATYHRVAGDADQARLLAARGLAYATTPRQPLALLAAHRVLGALDGEARRFGDARAHLDAALVLADTCGTPYERALVLLALAEWCGASGQPSDALRPLHEARETCLSLGARPALARCDALMARLGGIPVHATFPDRLTQREVDVLRLLADGRTNKEMAAALFLSTRTVERHIANIYTKVGAHGRADAAAYALRHGIVAP
jgi:DNA-binding CsgD family transcriptional regulator